MSCSARVFCLYYICILTKRISGFSFPCAFIFFTAHGIHWGCQHNRPKPRRADCPATYQVFEFGEQFLPNLDHISEVVSFKALRTVLYFDCCLFSTGSGISFILNVTNRIGLSPGTSQKGPPLKEDQTLRRACVTQHLSGFMFNNVTPIYTCSYHCCQQAMIKDVHLGPC